jgi:hypothetical protein
MLKPFIPEFSCETGARPTLETSQLKPYVSFKSREK